MHKEWTSCLVNPGNVKELIPEFYSSDPTFLKNDLKLDFGLRANGKRVDDIKLPKWAHDCGDFLRRMQEALESEYVNANLNYWIDLIFGFKQKSFDDNNVFHPLTYEGAVDIDKILDPVERTATELQVNEFG